MKKHSAYVRFSTTHIFTSTGGLEKYLPQVKEDYHILENTLKVMTAPGHAMGRAAITANPLCSSIPLSSMD